MPTPLSIELLTITPEIKAEAEKVLAEAQANRIPYDKLQALMTQPRGTIPPVTSRLKIQDYIVTITIEEQPEPLGWCKHVSIMRTTGNSPSRVHPVIAWIICQLFGCVMFPLDGIFYTESSSINILEPIDTPNERIKVIKERGFNLVDQPEPDTSLMQYAIYDHPSDYPKHFVMRRWAISKGKFYPEAHIHLYETLAQARADLPPGLVRLERFEQDDPKIVEVWT